MRELRTAITMSVLIFWAFMAFVSTRYDIVPADSAPTGTLREHLLYSVWYTTIALGIWTLLKMSYFTFADAVAGRGLITRTLAITTLVVVFLAIPGSLALLYYGQNTLWIVGILVVSLLVSAGLLGLGHTNVNSASNSAADMPQEEIDRADRRFLHEVIRPPVTTVVWLVVIVLALFVTSYFLLKGRILPYQWPSVRQSLFDATALIGAAGITYTLLVRWLWFLRWNNQLEGSTILILLVIIAVPAAVVCWFIYSDPVTAAVMWFLGGVGLVFLSANATRLMKTYMIEEAFRW